MSLYPLVQLQQDWRRVSSVRNLKLAMVIVELLLLDPRILDKRQRGSPITARMAIRHWDWLDNLGVESTRVRSVEEATTKSRCGTPLAETIASVLSDVGENVRANIPTAESVQVPIGLDGGDLRVVVVVVVVSGADEVLGN